MIQKLKPNGPMLEVLNTDGIFIVEDFILRSDLLVLKNEVLKLCEEEGGYYEFGRNYRGSSLKKYAKSSMIRKSFDQPWMKELASQYTNKRSNYCETIYATYDFKFDGTLARNGWLHFDRKRCLKFFIYLTDVDETSGAFYCVPGSKDLGSKLRCDAWNNTPEYGNVKNRIELDYKEIMDSLEEIPVVAKAGTLIVFDTDVFHRGGQCQENKERLVVRGHCYF